MEDRILFVLMALLREVILEVDYLVEEIDLKFQLGLIKTILNLEIESFSLVDQILQVLTLRLAHKVL